ncbi:hypothetical protein HNE_2898 [Hyphomonas neptunium ATCC 15444]|uniref:Uncharacterized protein n=1 Tax=Hyphomonas neptunium (strain ATCC 15444) TaxID=228405 RepID=Q0BY67_HYPNA|nr:hypothetical protein HNE_2898 [Hyphomonas neptunium ATCC 15444]
MIQHAEFAGGFQDPLLLARVETHSILLLKAGAIAPPVKDDIQPGQRAMMDYIEVNIYRARRSVVGCNPRAQPRVRC